jgi:DNA-binding XRE family transcriptional regulator
MQVVEKKHHIDITGNIPDSLLKLIVKKYGKKNVIIIDDDYVDVTTTEWYKKMEKDDTQGARLKRTRKRFNMTQAQLAKKVGEYTQHISNMEKGTRSISVEMAKKFGEVFGSNYRFFL